ncbi:MAG: hypothetical protein WCE44_02575 [Candidatus Velthaea sp.]
MAGTPPPGTGTIPIEYTRGTGAFFPTGATTAAQTGLTSAVVTVNGQQIANLTIEAGPSTGCVVTVTEPSPGTIAIGVNVSAPVGTAGVGTSYPASPAVGQLFYRTDLGHLYTWTGSAWGAS